MSVPKNQHPPIIELISKKDPANGRGRRLEPKARREQLLEHAISAFAKGGIERAVHADVAARANVSTPTVFKYFPTREALVKAVLDRVETTLTELIERIPDGSNISASDMTYIWAKALTFLCETKPDLMKVTLSWSVAFSSVRDRYIVFENRNLDMLVSRMDQPIDDRSDARILFASAILFIRMHFDNSSEDVRRRYVDRMAQIFATAPEQTPKKVSEAS